MNTTLRLPISRRRMTTAFGWRRLLQAPSNFINHALVYRYPSPRHLGIGSSRDSVESAMGTPAHVGSCDGYEALTYKTHGDPEGRYGYMFVLRYAKVVALRYTLNV